MISEDGKLRVELSTARMNNNSFLVALIPALPIPAEFTIHPENTGCAVIAANKCDTKEFAYVHLEADEKQFIGDCLAEACAPMNKWVWCNLYVL